MKKIIAIVMAAVIACSVFAGCDTQKKPNHPELPIYETYEVND